VPKPVSEIDSLASFSGPAGWRMEDDAILGDPLVSFSSGPYVVRVCLFGGKDSRHETPADFLSDPEARGDKGEPPLKLGIARVNGRRTPAYGRTYKVSMGDPHARAMASEETIRDEFVIVLAGKRFFVLTFKTAMGPAYEPDKRGTTAWAGFLKSFKLKK